MKKFLFILTLFFSFNLLNAAEIEFPTFLIQGEESELIITDVSIEDEVLVLIDGKKIATEFNESELRVPIKSSKRIEVEVTVNEERIAKEYNPIPLWMSIIPPLLAILLALIFKEVITALCMGLFAGCAIIYLHVSFSLGGWIEAFLKMMDTYILGSLNNSGHLSIITFSMLIGGMVAVISKNGGMQAVVNHISKYAKSAKSGQFATWLLGVVIFFDDYANTLIVGSTMRPITDRFKISREKLAYLVDSTAAPIASIAFVTTWIGAELGYIESGITDIPEIKQGVYAIFLDSLSYSFYPILALIFMLILIWKGKDFGPMLNAERLSRKSESSTESQISSDLEAFQAKEGVEAKAYNAIVPVMIVIFGTLAGLLYTGWDWEVWYDSNINFGSKLSSIIGAADSYKALLWSSAAGLIAAVKLSLFTKKLSLKESIESCMEGFKTMLPAIVILILAWSLAIVIEDLHTAELLSSLMSDNIGAAWVPAITFILAALVAFSTGSSWGTMAILYPLMLPAAWQISIESGLDHDAALSIFHNVVSCVLAGSVLGDHCSPISDTTILSSLASNCDHIQHVKTQMPYALTVGLVAIIFGTIPSAFGISPIICFPIAALIIFLIINRFGENVEHT